MVCQHYQVQSNTKSLEAHIGHLCTVKKKVKFLNHPNEERLSHTFLIHNSAFAERKSFLSNDIAPDPF